MNWWYIMVGCFLIGVIGVIIQKSPKYDMMGFVTAVIGFIFALAVLIVCILKPITNQKELYTFVATKDYVESHQVVNPLENAALTNTKIELNAWLFKAQYNNKDWGGWSFYPDSVQDLTPIE
jgi:hypothetical protein